jgi:putative transposase
MCAFYEVSRSGYYDWKKRGIPEVTADEKDLVVMIEECQRKNKHRLGYRRVVLWLAREKKLKVNHKRVLRITRKYRLQSIIRRRKIKHYKGNSNLKYENILNRDFHANKPNEKWVTDISYIITPGGTLYMSAIRDLFDNFVVAYKTSNRQNYPLVEETIKSALSTERPKQNVIFHSDQGGQYRSFEHWNITHTNPLIPSMSAPGSPGDNAQAENFFSIFKTECIYLDRPETPEEAADLTGEYIEYYNYNRIQLTGLTPFETRRRWFDEHATD